MAKAEKPDSLNRPPSAPKVPKELLSARPAMTKVVPRAPEKRTPSEEPQSAKPELTEKQVEERQERLDYLRSIRGDRPKKKGKKWLVVLIVMLSLGVLGTAAYWFFFRGDDSKTTGQSAQQPSVQADELTGHDNPEPIATKEYTATNFPIAFSYPEDWTVAETVNGITATSRYMKFQDTSGSTVSGAAVVTIRNKQASLPEFKSGNATAVLESQHLTYKAPAAGQRDSTYLSFLQYASTTAKGALDAVYITGNSGYQKGQFIPQADVVKVDPLITVHFVECASDTSCLPTGKSMYVGEAAWSGEFKATIEAMLQSLAIS